MLFIIGVSWFVSKYVVANHVEVSEWGRVTAVLEDVKFVRRAPILKI